MPSVWAAAWRVERVLARGARCGYGAAVASALPLREVPTLARALPDFLRERRLDDVAVIGQALALSLAGGLGMRPVAERLSVPLTTARAWRRRFRARALVLATALVALAVHLDPAPVLLSGTDHETAARAVLGATWHRARTRFGGRVPELWRFWSLISGGPALGTNRSPPFAPRSGAAWMVLIP